jgi:hypothetical protein
VLETGGEKQPTADLIVLDEIARNQVCVDEDPLPHGTLLRRRAAFAAVSRIWAKDMRLPLLLASAPFSERMPGWTRMVAWSSSMAYSSVSPGLILRALRTLPGMVVCPLRVTVECGIVSALLFSDFLTSVLFPTLCCSPRADAQSRGWTWRRRFSSLATRRSPLLLIDTHDEQE